MSFKTLGLNVYGSLKSNTLKASFAAVVGTAAIAISSGPAQAVSFTTGAGPLSPESGVTTINFDSLSVGTNPGFTDGIANYTGGAIVDNSVTNQFLAPFSSMGNYLTLGPATFQPSPVTITFNSSLNYFGLLWGSVDIYNTIEFRNSGQSVASFTGDLIFPPADGNPNPPGTAYVNFFANDPSQYFNQVVLSSSQFAFESDNHAYRVVPTPALLPGLIALGVGLLRKRKSEEMTQS
jgi:hypothetical protein